tara:strand:- start:9248 stop:9676 length:429 start_codon:yes stop_codon:yes gene_type:complete
MYSYLDVRKYLPQRDPFLFIDRIISHEKNKYINAQKIFKSDDVFLKGHFPGNPIIPGVILIEAMAQASGLILCDFKQKKSEKIVQGYLISSNTKFLKKLLPNNTVNIIMNVTLIADYIIKTSGFIEDKNKNLIAKGDISIAL